MGHRRRIKTEEKAKVVSAVWGRGAELDELQQDDMKTRLDSSLSSHHPGAK